MPLINISQQAERGFFTIEYRYRRRRRLILSDLSSPSFLSINARDGTQHEREVLRMIDLTEKSREGLRFYIEIYPSYNWIYGNGTMSYYQISEQMAEWINNNL